MELTPRTQQTWVEGERCEMKPPEIYTIEVSYEINDIRDKLFRYMWEELLDIYLLNKWDEGIEWLITSAIIYFGEHFSSDVLWKKLNIKE